MAKSFFGENSMRFLIKLVKAGLGLKIDAANIVNDLTTDDATKVLSAAQGKALKDEISQVSTEVTEGITDKIGQADGIAPLDSTGKVDAQYLPSYVDDVIEGYLVTTPGTNEGDPDTRVFYEEEEHTTEITGEKGKIYLDLSTNVSYRWSGTTYVMIESGDLVEITAEEVQAMWDSITVPETPEEPVA